MTAAGGRTTEQRRGQEEGEQRQRRVTVCHDDGVRPDHRDRLGPHNRPVEHQVSEPAPVSPVARDTKIG